MGVVFPEPLRFGQQFTKCDEQMFSTQAKEKKTPDSHFMIAHAHAMLPSVSFPFFYFFFFFLGIPSISPSYDTIVFKSHSKYICSTRSLQIIFILIFVKVNGEKKPFTHSTWRRKRAITKNYS